MKNPLIWLSGADFDILDKCKKTYRTQRIKFSIFGTLLLIPATVGLFSMMYAVSTLTVEPWFFVSAGIIWFLVVLFIDRSIIATFFKSKVEGNPLWASIIRLLFAVVVGIAVSHPMTLLWFNESIEQRIEEKKRTAVAKRREQSVTQINQIPKGSVSTKVEGKTARRDCLVNLMTLEQSGIMKDTECGASSGIKECGSRCENIKKEIAQINKELSSINAQATTELQQEANDRNNIQTLTNQDIEDIEKNFAKDYLARYDALIEIENENPHVAKVEWFILLLFVFLDSLVVLIKFVTPMGEYEYIRDTLLFDAKKTQEAEMAAIKTHAETTLPNILEAKRRYDSKENELTYLTDVTRQFLTEQEKIRAKFDAGFREIDRRIKKVRDNQLRDYYTNYLGRVRETFNIAWAKAYDKFHEFINSL